MRNDLLRKKIHINTDDNGALQVRDLSGKREIGLAIKEQNNVGHLTLDFFLYSLSSSINLKWGVTFFIFLCIFLLVAIITYVNLHSKIENKITTPISDSLSVLIDEMKVALGDDKAQAVNLNAKLIEMGVILKAVPESSVKSLIPATSQIEARIAQLKEQFKPNSKLEKVDVISKLIGSLRAGVDELKNKETSMVKDNPIFFFWAEGGMKWAEVAFWAIFGISAQLILTAGNYLRRKKFYTSGIWQHLSLLLTVPLLTLVFVFLISTLKLEFPGPGNELVTFDLSNPLILSAISFVLAIVPWKLWDKLRQTGAKLTKSSDNNDE